MYTQALRLGEASTSLPVEILDLTAEQDPQALPDPTEFQGIVMTGSASMIGEQTPWMKASCRYLELILEKQVPFLGVCFGHQMLGLVAGAEVGPNPLGREMGTVRVYTTDQTDLFYSRFPASFLAQVTHVDVILKSSPQITVVGRTAHDDHHMIRVGPTAFGVQFHPEFSSGVISAYLRARQSVLESERGPGSCQQRLQTVRETPFANQILAHFRDHALEHPSG